MSRFTIYAKGGACTVRCGDDLLAAPWIPTLVFYAFTSPIPNLTVPISLRFTVEGHLQACSVGKIEPGLNTYVLDKKFGLNVYPQDDGR